MATEGKREYQRAHAIARKAVQAPLDSLQVGADIDGFGLPVLTVASAVDNKQQYLMRPDLGRHLAPSAEAIMASHAGEYDTVFVISDGLSARAVQTHAQPVL